MLEQGEILRERYKIIRRLGQGGMGAVYEAHDNVFDTSVALKEVTIDLSNTYDTEAQEMMKLAFEREAKILAKINHETIPHVKDYFIENDAQFLVMELVDGDDLAKLLKQHNAPFPIGTIVEWTDQLLDALDYLHNQNPPIIHRDIKPQNLKLTTRKKIKLLDFGIAKGTESVSANTITNQTFIAATLNYSPIEQMVRVLDPTFLAVITHKYSSQIERILEENADYRTDIFALGATLYHLATNKQPAEAVKRGIDIWDGKPDPLENPQILNPEIPEEFSDFLLKSMQINRDHRFSSAADMKNALREISGAITSPTLNPTVEMNMANIGFDKTQPDFTPQTPTPLNETPVPTPVNPPPPHISAETETEIAKPKPPPQTQQQQYNSHPQNTASNTNPQPPQEKKKTNKLLWLIPVAGLVLLMLVGGAVGVWLVVSNMGEGTTTEAANVNSNTENRTAAENVSENANSERSDIITDSDTNSGSSNTENNDAEPTPYKATITETSTNPTPQPTRKSTPQPTPDVVRRTPRPTPAKTPVKKPTPKKNMDCIFTDSCE